MGYPNHPDKHAFEPLVTPERQVAYLRHALGLDEWAAPRSVVLSYQRPVLRAAEALPGAQRVDWPGMDLVQVGDVGVVGGFGFGAPVTIVVVELLAALGATTFVTVGTAGALGPGLGVGDVVVCDRAVRDEGVSHHYLPARRWAHPDPALTDGLHAALARGGGAGVAKGPVWTIDAIYRETREEVAGYRDEGVLAVEMEAAALFAVAEAKGLAAAGAFVMSDILGDEWEPRMVDPAVRDGLGRLLPAALAALGRGTEPGAGPPA